MKNGVGDRFWFFFKKVVSLQAMNIFVLISVQVSPAARPQGVKYGHQKEMQPRAVVNSGVTAGVINLKYYRRKHT